jgi:hypothetical protein
MLAQIDSLEYLDYYPLHVGDKWVYEIIQLGVEDWDTTYQTITVTSDTVMPNGYHYFYMSPSGTYQRLDSIQYCVKFYDSSEETKLFDLNPFEGEIDSMLILPDSVMLIRKKITGNAGTIVGNFEKLGFCYYWDELGGPYEELTKGIGYTKYFCEEAMPYLRQLVGAEIDGIVYGNISDIVSSINRPKQFHLYPNYPNPFNNTTNIVYTLSKNSDVILSIYDITGRLLETIVNQHQNTGTFSICWNASRYSSGVYLYKIKTDGFQQVKKMLLIK